MTEFVVFGFKPGQSRVTNFGYVSLHPGRALGHARTRGGRMHRFWRDQSGASAAEYSLLIAILGVGLGAAALALGANLTSSIGLSANRIHAANDAESHQDTGGGTANGPPSTAPGQNPGPGQGNSSGNPSPGTPPGSPPGKPDKPGKPNK